jgi:uncharacterized membrane protein YqiK
VSPELQLILVIVAAVIVFVGGLGFLVARFYRQVNQGQALIVNKLTQDPVVTFTGATVLPIIHRAEIMDISLKTIELERRGKEGLICKDNIRADIKVTFFVRVNKTAEDVLKVAQSIGCARASDQNTMETLFEAKFSEALKTVGKRLMFVELYDKRDVFKDEIIKVIGQDLNGYGLEDAAIDYLEQTPLEHMDKDNILDAEGIRKITELTAAQAILTNEFRQEERKAIKKKDVEAQETILELERIQADAENKQKREIASIKAREEAATATIQAEEAAKANLSKIKAEEEVFIAQENKHRQIEVAQKNRLRVVAVENERVERDRELEVISRQREVELNRIAKEKELEIKRKEIADVIRTRIVVDKTVATEEEAIKDLRANALAKRDKDVLIIAAEAAAEEKLVKEIKAAKAQEEASQHLLRLRLATAETDLEAADKHAKAKIRLSEGVQAEAAAKGLAEARVQEAQAVAFEKQGLVEARVQLERMQAQAAGEEKQGLARAKVSEIQAEANQKQGMAEANVIREKLLAEATGAQEKGLAEMKVREAEALAIEKKALAEAAGVREKLVAEATGLSQKAAAMKALDEAGRGHEEFRLRLQKEQVVEVEAIHARRDMATAQATIMKEAFHQAKINIVGGDGQFFDKFMGAVTMGHTLDGAIQSSDSLQRLLKDYLDGKASLPNDLKEVLSRPAVDADTLQKLSLSAVLARLASGGDAGVKNKVQTLLAKAKEMGLGDTPIG